MVHVGKKICVLSMTLAFGTMIACGESEHNLNGSGAKSVSKKPDEPTAPTTTIVGTLVVTDAAGVQQPVEGAQVTLAGAGKDQWIETAKAGTFELEVPESLTKPAATLTQGLTGLFVDWHAIHPNHHVGVKQENVAVELQKRNDLGTVVMIANASVKGRVKHFEVTGVRPVANAEVYIDKTNYATITDAEGNFEIKDLPPAKWTVKAKTSELGADEVTVTLTSGKEHDVGTLTLKK